MAEISFENQIPLAIYLLLGLGCLSLVLLAKRGVISAILRTITVFLFLLSLSGPYFINKKELSDISSLVDVSFSIPNNIFDKWRNFSPRNIKKVYPFAGETGYPQSDFTVSELLNQAKKINNAATNLELAFTKEDESQSILLFSDGFQTEGDAIRGAEKLARKGVAVYPIIIAPEYFRGEGLKISNLYAPQNVAAGETAEIIVALQNMEQKVENGRIEITVGTEKLLNQTIKVPPGEEKRFVLKTGVLKPGLNEISVKLKNEDQESERHRFVTVKEKDKILLISTTQAENQSLKGVLTAKGVEVEDLLADGSVNLNRDFIGYAGIIFNNVPRGLLPTGFLDNLKKYVELGGGVLIVGGEKSFGLGGYLNSTLEEISPVKFLPPQTEKKRVNNAIALVIDKSGSMGEDNKMEAAKKAALSSINSLNDDDFLGVIGFDSGPFVIIDVKPVPEVKIEAERRLQNLTPAGKTNLLPALSAARVRLERSGAGRKHIIVLSDGKFPLTPEAYVDEINELRKSGITVSAVALGADADIPFMKMLSKYGEGAFYNALAADTLPEIFVKDIKVATGEKTLHEQHDFKVELARNRPVTNGISEFPLFQGFVETIPKPGSSIELGTLKNDKNFPLFANWNFQKGRVAVFTSDSGLRWTNSWRKWEEYVSFWNNLVQSIKKGDEKGKIPEFDFRYAINGNELAIQVAVFEDKLELANKIQTKYLTPKGEMKSIELKETADGYYEGRITNIVSGDYKFDLTLGGIHFPKQAINIQGDVFGEKKGGGINYELLEKIATITGGKINPSEKDFLQRKKIVEEKEPIWRKLLLLAILFLFADAIVGRIKTKNRKVFS